MFYFEHTEYSVSVTTKHVDTSKWSGIFTYAYLSTFDIDYSSAYVEYFAHSRSSRLTESNIYFGPSIGGFVYFRNGNLQFRDYFSSISISSSNKLPLGLLLQAASFTSFEAQAIKVKHVFELCTGDVRKLMCTV